VAGRGGARAAGGSLYLPRSAFSFRLAALGFRLSRRSRRIVSSSARTLESSTATGDN
jgi:hypothetical protein